MSFSTEVKNRAVQRFHAAGRAAPARRPTARCCTPRCSRIRRSACSAENACRRAAASGAFAARVLLWTARRSKLRPQAAASSSTIQPQHRAASSTRWDMTRKSHITYHLNRNVLEEDCCIAAFLRGAFLMAGTVAGPDKKSHLELKSTPPEPRRRGDQPDARPRSCHPSRQGVRSAQLLYFKDSASVEDFLTRIGAPHAAMELMQAKVEKNIRNTINRQVNCETANLDQGGGRVRAADRRDHKRAARPARGGGLSG